MEKRTGYQGFTAAMAKELRAANQACAEREGQSLFVEGVAAYIPITEPTRVYTLTPGTIAKTIVVQNQWPTPKSRVACGTLGTATSTEYATLSVDAWEMSPRASAEIAPLIPSEKDLRDEFLRVVRAIHGVEVCAARYPNARAVYTKMDPGRACQRQKFYARAMFEREVIFARDVDRVRAGCFEAARLLAGQARRAVHQFCQPPRGASVDYNSALSRPHCVALRLLTAEPVRYLRPYNDPDGAFAAYDHSSDQVMIRFASYFAVTAPGEEVDPDE